MAKKKRYLIILFIVFFVIISAIGLPIYYEWQEVKNNVAKAELVTTYLIALVGVNVIPCFTTGVPPVCNGGALCYTKDAATCTLYADVSGMPFTPMGNGGVFLKTDLAKAGVVPGGYLIAGGISPVFIRFVAGIKGCAGCD